MSFNASGGERIRIESRMTIVECPSEKKKLTSNGRLPSCMSLRVTLSIAEMIVRCITKSKLGCSFFLLNAKSMVPIDLAWVLPIEHRKVGGIHAWTQGTGCRR